jgi:hypothetical protein
VMRPPRLRVGEEGADLIEAAGFVDSPTHTWGLITTRAHPAGATSIDWVG